MGTVTQPCTQYGGAWEPSIKILYLITRIALAHPIVKFLLNDVIGLMETFVLYCITMIYFQFPLLFYLCRYYIKTSYEIRFIVSIFVRKLRMLRQSETDTVCCEMLDCLFAIADLGTRLKNDCINRLLKTHF